MPEAQHPVVEMFRIGGERRLSGTQPAHHGQSEVEQRQEHHGDRQDDRHEGGERPLLADQRRIDLTGDPDRRGGQQQADEHRPGVAHEDPGRIEVMRQEAEAGADENRDDERGEVRIGLRRGVARQPVGVDEERASADGHDSGCEPVEPVDEVHGVDGHEDDEDGDDDRHPRGADDDPAEGNRQQRHSLDRHEAGGKSLAGELRHPMQVPDVVDDSEQTEQSGGTGDADDRSQLDEDPIEERHLGGEDEPGEEPAEHGHSAQPRRRD